MAEQIAPGTWWLHGARGSNVYLIEATDGRLALIDAGFGSGAESVLAEVESVANGRPLSHILLTHGHFDHSGAAGEIRRETGAALAAGRDDCHQRQDGQWVLNPNVGRTHVVRLFMRKVLHRGIAETPVDTILAGEVEVLPGLRAVPVPGHTPGSCCYVAEAAGIAFVGDIVIHHGDRLTRPLRWANHDDALYLQTLATFAHAAPAAGCPGHGPPLMEGFGDAMRILATIPRGARWEGESRLQALRRRTRLLRSFGGNLGKRRDER